MNFKRLFLWTCCLIASIAAAWLSASLVNSFGQTSWEYTPLPIGEPNVAFIGLCWSMALLGLMYVGAWLVRHGTGKMLTLIAAATLGTAVTAVAMLFPIYLIDGAKSTDYFFAAGAQSFLISSFILSLFVTTIGVTIGTKAFFSQFTLSNNNDQSPGDPSPGSGIRFGSIRRAGTRFGQMFRMRGFHGRMDAATSTL